MKALIVTLCAALLLASCSADFGNLVPPGFSENRDGSQGAGAGTEYPMRRMTARGFPATLELFASERLSAVLAANPFMPTEAEEILNLAYCYYTGERNGRPCRDVFRLRDGKELSLNPEHGKAESMLFLALRNDGLSDAVRDEVDALIARRLPQVPREMLDAGSASAPARFRDPIYSARNAQSSSAVVGPCTVGYWSTDNWRQCITDKFWVNWYGAPGTDVPVTATLSDQDVFNMIADLNAAWAQYEQSFGSDHVPELYPQGYAGVHIKLKIDFTYYKSLGWPAGAYGVTNSSKKFIALNPVSLNQYPQARKPVTAHELFHRVQYTFGYGAPEFESGDWFVEGTASWAESFVWNRTSANFKYVYFYEKPFVNLLFDYDESFWTDKAYAAANFWYFLDDHLGTDPIPELMNRYQSGGGQVLPAVNQILYDHFGSSGVFNNFEDYLALWRRDKIRQIHAPKDVQNVFDQPVGPLQARLYRTRHFTPDKFQPWSGAFALHGNGSEHGFIYVDPALKTGAQSLRLTFAPSDPNVPFQYQVVLAKCVNGLFACGIPDEGFLETNVPYGSYQNVQTLYPFFAEHDHEMLLSLDPAGPEWDLLYIVLGNRSQDSAQESISVGAELWDNP